MAPFCDAAAATCLAQGDRRVREGRLGRAANVVRIMRVGDLVSVTRVPTVVQLSFLEDLRYRLDLDGQRLSAATSGRLGAIVAEFIVRDAANVAAVEALLSGLARPDRGGGFLVSGAHGSGKTHLLAVLALLAEYAPARRAFAQTHAAFEVALAPLDEQRRTLVVPISLDEHRGRDEQLEDIVFDAAERELRRPKYDIHVPLSEQSYALDLIDRHVTVRHLGDLESYVRRQTGTERSWSHIRTTDPPAAVHLARQFLDDINYPLDFRQLRAERLRRLRQVLEGNGFRGVLWVVDELSLFLGSMGIKSLNADCAFLQFLGQQAAGGPFWLVGAMREGLAELSEVDTHLLGQMRQRFHTGLHLSTEQASAVAVARVLRRPDAAKFADAVAHLYRGLRAGFGPLEFSQDQLATAYPLHPMTLTALEGAAARIFSHTRSAMDFVQTRVAGDSTRSLPGVLDRDFRTLVLPAEVFDHFREEMGDEHLRALTQEVYDYFARNAAGILAEREDLGLALIRTLVVFQAAGIEATVRRLTQATVGLVPESAENPYAHVQYTLEALRLRGSYLDVRRREGEWADVYVLDAQPVPQSDLRRQVVAAKSSLADDDPRVAAQAVAATAGGDFPLAELADARSVEIEWENTARRLAVALGSLLPLTSAALTRAMTTVAEEKAPESVQLFVADLLKPREQMEHWGTICTRTPASRWRHGLIAWAPRPLTAAELDVLKDHAALRLLPAERAGESATETESLLRDQVRRIVADAYAGGTVVTGGAAALREGLTGLRSNWPALLARIAALGLERAFPRFPDVAPRTKLPETGPLRRWAGRIMRSADAARIAMDERGALACLEPAGVAAPADGGLSLTPADSPVAAEILRAVSARDARRRAQRGEPVAVGDLLARLAKTDYGIPESLGWLILAAMVRLGYLEALDSARRRLPIGAGSAIAAEAVAYVARAPLLEHDEWQEVARLSRAVLNEGIVSPDPATQQRIWEGYLGEKAAAGRRLGTVRAGLDDLLRELGHGPDRWPESLRALDEAQAFLACIDPSLPAAEGLRELVAAARQLYPSGSPAQGLRTVLGHVAAIDRFLEEQAQQVVAAGRYVAGAEVPDDAPALKAHAERLQRFLGSGERLVHDETTLRRLQQSFLGAYQRAYLAWHERVRSAPEFQQYAQLESLPAYRALERLSRLPLPAPRGIHTVDAAIGEAAARQCSNPHLQETLQHEPRCPDCRLALGQDLDLVPPRGMAELTQEILAERLRALGEPTVRAALATYAASTPSGDLRRRLEAIPSLAGQTDPAAVLATLTDELMHHLHRALSAQPLHWRSLAALQQRLSGRTLTKAGLRAALREWLADQDLGDDEELYVE